MLSKQIQEIAKRGKSASIDAARLNNAQKNALLLQMASELLRSKNFIFKANQKDLQAAQNQKASDAFLDRLKLSKRSFQEMVSGVRATLKLPDPVGQIVKKWKAPSGVSVTKVRIPLGVIGVIYESRPNVTVDTAALTLKSGNAIILKGGSESFETNKALAKILRGVLKRNRINSDIIQFLPTTDRKALPILLRQDAFIDLIIPRGGESLMKLIRKYATIPVIRHDKGVCHVFVDRDADLKMAQKICLNAKVQRPSTCNAMETLLVDEKIAKEFLAPMLEQFRKAGVEIRGDEKTCRLAAVSSGFRLKKTDAKDWSTEYLDKILSIKIVRGLDEAIEHIQKYGSLHTESIITEDKKRAKEFCKRVTASCVMVNASTRLNDGYQLGLGAEIGISTTKLHAFGPMGLEELTTLKFVVWGKGEIRK